MNIIMAALKQQHNRVCQITITDIPNSMLKKFAAIKTPFPALTILMLRSTDESAPIRLDSFLEGSAPRLQSLWLHGIPFPSLGKLLLSSCDLSELFLDNILRSGYISPDALVSSLSGLTRLRILFLQFQSPRPRALRERRVPPSPTRIVLPPLSILYFKGDSEYLEDMLSRMENLLVNVHVRITFFNQLVFDTPLLRDLIGHVETFKAHHRAEISFSSDSVLFTLFSKDGQAESEVLKLRISCRPSDWQLSSLAQVIGSSIPPLLTLDRLELRGDHHQPQHWQDDIENAQWLESLRPFTSVKDLVPSGELVRLVAPRPGRAHQGNCSRRVTCAPKHFCRGCLAIGISSLAERNWAIHHRTTGLWSPCHRPLPGKYCRGYIIVLCFPSASCSLRFTSYSPTLVRFWPLRCQLPYFFESHHHCVMISLNILLN